MQFIGKDCTTICHSKLSIPIMADLFAPATSVARAGSPCYTDCPASNTDYGFVSPEQWFANTIVGKHVNCVTMECLVSVWVLTHILYHFCIIWYKYSGFPTQLTFEARQLYSKHLSSKTLILGSYRAPPLILTLFYSFNYSLIVVQCTLDLPNCLLFSSLVHWIVVTFNQ